MQHKLKVTLMWNKIRKFYAKHPVWASLIGMVPVAIIIAWLAMLFLSVWTHHGDNATVPEIKNLPYDEAERVLARNNLRIEISDSIYDKSLAPGTIVESWPKAGAVVKSGRSVYVTLTAFSAKHVTISMPITGVSARQAVSYLTALGITSIRYVSVPSQYPDLVESAHAEGRPIGVGSVIPVDATVVLEVGVAPVETEEPTDSVPGAEAEIQAELEETGMSTYTDI